MAPFNRLIRSAKASRCSQAQRDYLTDIICGPDTTYRSELIEAISDTR